jgi:polysaccharide biosynthesis/export protein
MPSDSQFIGSTAHVMSATSRSKALHGLEGASAAPVRSAGKRSYAWVRRALACALVVSTVATSGCAADRFRFDRMRESDGVAMRELEDMIKDGEAAEIRSQQIEYDFAAERDEYQLGRNDVLTIFVMGHPELSSQVVGTMQEVGTRIRKDGHIHLPMIGPVPAAGLTLTEFEQRLNEAISKFVVAPQVSVEIAKHESQKFFVLGHVRLPGAFPVDGDTTVLEGLSLAGGVPETGWLSEAVVVRSGQILPIDLGAMVEEGDTSRNVFMRAGDVVYVPNRTDAKVYVLGEVQQPKVVPITGSRITLAEALASAGGPMRGSARRELAIIRGGFAKPLVYIVELDDALLVDERVLLKPGDRVVVAPTGMTNASRYMQQVLPFLQGAQAIGLAASGGSAAAAAATAAAANLTP